MVPPSGSDASPLQVNTELVVIPLLGLMLAALTKVGSVEFTVTLIVELAVAP